MSDALVVPRVLSPISGESLPLDAVVADVLEARGSGPIALVGPPGAGKTTALRWILRREPRLRPPEDDILFGAGGARVPIYATAASIEGEHRAVLPMASWGVDEAIEHLLARHASACASVMARVDDPEFAQGLPGLWVPLLDRLAANPDLLDLRAAVLQDAAALSTFHSVQVLLHATRHVEDLRRGQHESFMRRPTAAVVAEIVRLTTPEDLSLLMRLLSEDDAAMVVSVLHAAKAEPAIQPGCGLRGALLPGIELPGNDLRLIDASYADFDRARLDGSDLSFALARGASFRRADLRRASFEETRAPGASFEGARMANIRAEHADFTSAVLRGADLRGGYLRRASFEAADLRGACFDDANLDACRLSGARLDEASFAGANLRHVDLMRQDLRRVDLERTDLSYAHLERARLAGVHAPQAWWRRAALTGADLTGAHMPGANLRETNLSYARLGDVNWERVDLRRANLCGVSFHMGSSRSGLVDSPIACEGSRTGFYTDEYHESHFKAPEEIRKANLRGADLRGAAIDQTDFYLVDLRDAHYTPSQARILKQSGAILRAYRP